MQTATEPAYTFTQAPDASTIEDHNTHINLTAREHEDVEWEWISTLFVNPIYAIHVYISMLGDTAYTAQVHENYDELEIVLTKQPTPRDLIKL